MRRWALPLSACFLGGGGAAAAQDLVIELRQAALGHLVANGCEATRNDLIEAMRPLSRRASVTEVEGFMAYGRLNGTYEAEIVGPAQGDYRVRLSNWEGCE